MSPVKIDGAKRQLFSLVKEQNIKLEAVQKKKKGRSSPTETSDAADAAAQPPETDAAEAGMEPEEEAEQVVADGQKKKKRLQGKKEESAPATADSGSVGQAIKRKRKDDTETKVSLVTVSAAYGRHRFDQGRVRLSRCHHSLAAMASAEYRAAWLASRGLLRCMS